MVMNTNCKKFKKFGDTKIEKQEFYSPKTVMDINDGDF